MTTSVTLKKQVVLNLFLFVATILVTIIVVGGSQKVNAQIVTPLANSSFTGSNSVQSIPLSTYRWYIDQASWPLRSWGCVPAGNGTPYKSLPWLADATIAGWSYSGGNSMNNSDNCNDRYRDGGWDIGAWLYPSALGGWANDSSSFSGWSDITYPSSAFAGTCSGIGNFIWAGGRDFTNHAPSLLNANGWFPPTPYPLGLYGNGAMVLRNTFTITAAQFATLSESTSSVQVRAAADDWLRVFVNGIFVGQITDVGSGARTFSLPKSFLRQGTNSVSIQAVDKAVWTFSYPGSATIGYGMCFALNMNSSATPPPPSAPPPPPPNTAPTLSITASCSAVGTLSIRMNASDANGDPLSGSFSGPPGISGTQLNSTVTFTGLQDGLPRTVTGNISDGRGGTASANATYTCLTPPPPPPPPLITCSITNAADFEPGNSFTPQVRWTSAATSPIVHLPVTARIDYTFGPPGNVPRSVFPVAVTNNTATPTSDVVSMAPQITVPAPGSYAQTAVISWVPVAPNDIPVVGGRRSVSCVGGGGPIVTGSRLPYFKVLGGSVVSLSGTVRGWNMSNSGYVPNDGSGRRGSGAQSAVMASGEILGLKSAQGRLAGSLKPLTFANAGLGDPSSAWGGGFGAPLGWTWAAPLRPTTGTTFISGGTINRPSGNYFSSGVTSTTGGAIGDGRQVSLYVTGDITITGNITYPSTYGSLAAIPRIRIVAAGNIFIHPSVTQVDAELYAGNFVYTCHDGTWNVPISINLESTPCSSNALLVNGIVSASAGIKLTRVGGTLRNSAPGDAARGLNATTYTNFRTGENNIAEIFQFTPESYLALPGVVPGLLGSNQQVQSITSLPPLY